MKQLQDVEKLVVDQLTELLDDVTVGIGVPDDWTPKQGDHIQVANAGTDMDFYPIGTKSTVRFVAWSTSPSRSKELAALAQTSLYDDPGPDIVSALPVAGPLSARDEETRAEVTSVLSTVTIRTV